MVTVKLVQSAAKSISSFLSALWNSHVHHGIMTCIIMFVPTDSWSLEHSTKINNNHYKLKSLSFLRLVKTEQNRSAIFLNQCLWCHLDAVRLGSHLRQNWDKFVLITKKSVKFLSSVDHAKCELLVSTQTKTFCKQKQKNCFSCDKPTSQFSETYIFFCFTFHILLRPLYRSWKIMNAGFRKQFSRLLGHPFQSNDEPKWSARPL